MQRPNPAGPMFISISEPPAITTIYILVSVKPRVAAVTKMTKMNFSIRPILIVLLFAVLAAIFSFASNLAPTNPKEYFSNAVKIIKGEFLALADEIVPDETYFFPTYPGRLMYLVAEISQSGKELVSLNEELKSSIGGCNCQFAESQCQGNGTFCKPGPLKTFGEPCQNREQIRKKQSEVMDKNDQIAHLKDLLQKEMDTGLERELMTLKPEVAEELKSNLGAIINESNEILSPAEKNQGLPETCMAENCSASCSLGSIFSLKACLMVGTGEQKQLEVAFKAGISLDDLNLGQIGIKILISACQKKFNYRSSKTSLSPFLLRK